MTTKTTAKKAVTNTKTSANSEQKTATQNVSSIRGDNPYPNVYSQWLRQKNVFGYLHSVRAIPNSFPSKLGATISVPQGDDVRNWETFQVIVNSYDAHSLFDAYQGAIECEDNNVTVMFDVTNVKSKHYMIEEGDRQGEIIDYWECKLTDLSKMSIDGNVVYSLKDKTFIPPQQFYSDHAG